jgi:AcrR family transcriptional regulator
MALKEAEREKTALGADGDAGASARERILEEAQRVFANYGFDGASMRQIAEAAGVPVALVSYHFGSKEGLYRAVFYRRVPAIIDQRAARSRPPARTSGQGAGHALAADARAREGSEPRASSGS